LKLDWNDKGIEELTTASRLDPTSFTPWVYLGVTYTKEEKYAEAIVSLKKAVSLYEEDAYTYYYLGYAHYSMDDWNKANEALTKAIKLNPKESIKPLVYELRGRTLLYLGDYAGAINDSKATIQLSPNDPDPWLVKGKAELKIGLRDEAMKSLSKAKKLGSAEAEYYMREVL